MSPATPFFRNIAAFRLLLCILFRICSGCCLRFSIETAPVTGIMITAIIGSFFFFSSIVILFLIRAVRISALRIIYILIVSLISFILVIHIFIPPVLRNHSRVLSILRTFPQRIVHTLIFYLRLSALSLFT